MLAFSGRQRKDREASLALEPTRSTGYVVRQSFSVQDANGSAMGFQSCIKENSRRISDAAAGSRDYFELATTNLSLYRALRAAAARHARGRLLDAGAGRMAYRTMLEEFCASYESLDITGSAERLDHVADLQRTGLPGAQYDSIFCSQVLHHLPEPELALREIARLLKPGGKAILSVPHLVWLHNEPHDYWRFTGYGLRHLLEKSGLRPISIEPAGGLICFLAYAPSTAALALLWPLRPAFRAGLRVNRLFIRLALLADRCFGVKSLYPANFIAVAERP
jgi:SAM-dependent methyltransferase